MTSHEHTRVVGIGIDLTDVGRLAEALRRRSGLAARLFTSSELELTGADDDLVVAQRFAVKEAVMKALGVGIDSVAFTDIELDTDLTSVTLRGRAEVRASELGAAAPGEVHLELAVGSIDGPLGQVAVAEVVASSTVT